MKRIVKRLLCIALVLLTVTGTLAGTAFADSNVCAKAKGTSAKTVTLQVTTGNRLLLSPYIKLSQTKGTMKIEVLRLDAHDYKTNKAMYEYYLITKYKLTNGKYRQQGSVIKWSGTASKTISLDKNSTYKIRIEPYAVKYRDDFSWGALFNPYPYSVFPLKVWQAKGWVKNASWKVASYCKIKTCKVVAQ